MILPNDLRIGNLVARKAAPKGITTYHKVLALEKITLRIDNYPLLPEPSIGDVEYESVNGIPLTPEILEKCGFKRVENQKDVTFENEYQDKIRVNELSYRFSLSRRHSFWVDVKYLHELQNWYIKAERGELEIKELA